VNQVESLTAPEPEARAPQAKRLGKLSESVEATIRERLSRFTPSEAALARLNDMNDQTEENRLEARDRACAKQQKKERAERRAGEREAAHLATQRQLIDKRAGEFETVGRLLRTGDLQPLEKRQARRVGEALAALPVREPEKLVRVEVAAELGFEALDLPDLLPLAEKMGHFLREDGVLDVAKLAEPKEQFFLATLAALVSAYDHGGLVFPARRFVDLPKSEMQILNRFFLDTLKADHPHLDADGRYKAPTLVDIAQALLARANAIRAQAGTDLFEKALPESLP